VILPNATFVFLGPSLPLQVAKKILPNAYYMPPIRCGDILHVMRLKPAVILIVDGYFEKTLSVWHKEILYALERGVHVVGCSSMGALRASELDLYGMIGVGKIYEDYRTGLLNDDDEVTVIHQSHMFGYQPLTDAMVNIRASVHSALIDHIIDEQSASIILRCAKDLFYRSRTLKDACDKATQMGASNRVINQFLSWISNGGIVDQKQQDAIQALTLLNQDKTRLFNFQASTKTDSLSKTLWFRTLLFRHQCKPFPTYQTWLPAYEKTLSLSRLLGKDYVAVKRLSYLMAIVYRLAQDYYQDRDNNKIFVFTEVHLDAKWRREDSIHDEYADQLLERLGAISQFYYDNNNAITDATIKNAFIKFMKASGIYLKYKKKQPKNTTLDAIVSQYQHDSPDAYMNLFYTAYLWSVIEIVADNQKLELQDHILLHTMKNLTTQHEINTQAELEKWLSDNDLNEEQYLQLIKSIAQFDYFVTCHNFDVLLDTCMPEERIHWLLDALVLTNNYANARQLGYDSSVLDTAVKNIRDVMACEGESFLYSIDFDLGEIEFREFIAAVCSDREGVSG